MTYSAGMIPAKKLSASAVGSLGGSCNEVRRGIGTIGRLSTNLSVSLSSLKVEDKYLKSVVRGIGTGAVEPVGVGGSADTGDWTKALPMEVRLGIGTIGVVGLSVCIGEGAVAAVALFFLKDMELRSSFCVNGRVPGPSAPAVAGAEAAAGCTPRWAKRAFVELPAVPVMTMGISLICRLRWRVAPTSSTEGLFMGIVVFSCSAPAALADSGTAGAASGDDGPEKRDPPDSWSESCAGSGSLTTGAVFLREPSDSRR